MFKAYPTVYSSCLHSAPNNPSCFSPRSLSGWFISSLCFPLFPDLGGNESQFHAFWSLHRGSVFFLPCGQCLSHWLLSSTLYQGSPSDLLCLFISFCHFTACSICLNQAPTISSASRKGIFAQSGQMSCSRLCQGLPASLPVPHQSSPHTVPGSPCSRVLESSGIFMKSPPDHNTRNS